MDFCFRMGSVEEQERNERVAQIASLDQPLRAELYTLLVERDDWVGRDDAAETLGIARSAAAFHLDKLAESGLVEVTFERPPGRGGPGAGRPAKKYRRAPEEVSLSLPDRHYDLAGALLADAIAESAATGRSAADAVGTAARVTGRRFGRALRGSLGSETEPAAVRDAALSRLTELGYEPRHEDGDIALANCPFHALASRHRSLVCGMNLDLISGLTEGLDATGLLEPRLDPVEGYCCVRLGFPQPIVE